MEGQFRSNAKGMAYVWFLASCGLFFGIGIGAFGSFFKYYIKNFPKIADTKEKQTVIEGNINFLFALGGLAACIVGGFIYDFIGRFPSMLLMFALEFMALGGMAVKCIHVHYCCRFVWGFAGCFSTLLVPCLMNETLPRQIQKLYSPFFATFLIGGIFLGYSFGFPWTETFWRVPLMWALVPETIKFVLLLALFRIESPVWLNERRRSPERIEEECKTLYTDASARLITQKLVDSRDKPKAKMPALSELTGRSYRIQLFLAILLNLLNQLTGINFLILYAEKIFKGIVISPATLARLPPIIASNIVTILTMGVGFTNFVASLCVNPLLKRFTERQLMIFGIFGQALGYVISISGFAFNLTPLSILGPYVYIYSFGLSLASLIYAYCAKLVPPSALALCAIAQWIFTCLIAKYMNVLGPWLGNLRTFFIFELLTVLGGILFIGYSIDNLAKDPAHIVEDYEKKGFFS